MELISLWVIFSFVEVPTTKVSVVRSILEGVGMHHVRLLHAALTLGIPDPPLRDLVPMWVFRIQVLRSNNLEPISGASVSEWSASPTKRLPATPLGLVPARDQRHQFFVAVVAPMSRVHVVLVAEPASLIFVRVSEL
jgi:hypothetical protein